MTADGLLDSRPSAVDCMWFVSRSFWYRTCLIEQFRGSKYVVMLFVWNRPNDMFSPPSPPLLSGGIIEGRTTP